MPDYRTPDVRKLMGFEPEAPAIHPAVSAVEALVDRLRVLQAAEYELSEIHAMLIVNFGTGGHHAHLCDMGAEDRPEERIHDMVVRVLKTLVDRLQGSDES